MLSSFQSQFFTSANSGHANPATQVGSLGIRQILTVADLLPATLVL